MRNDVQFRSKHALGLAIFVALLLAENALALYRHLLGSTLLARFATGSPAISRRATMFVHALESLALLFLVRVTWDYTGFVVRFSG